MIQVLVTVFAGLFGLALGSFLNVCATRWPEEESVLKRRSHCRSCDRDLSWWENIPLASWLAVKGRCRTCGERIGWRYPLAELAVGALWAFDAWQTFAAAPELATGNIHSYTAAMALANGIANLIFLWILVALTVLDLEVLWLPDRIILPGIGVAFALAFAKGGIFASSYFGGGYDEWQHFAGIELSRAFLSGVMCAGAIVVIRFLYIVIRGQEGIGWGDVKMIAMLGAWQGIKCTTLAFGIAVVVGALVGLLALARPKERTSDEVWATKKLPFGAFLSLGAVITAFWGVPLVGLYARLVGF
jgi:leader peptidase (prepilin peptidase) / N-methyltransferase